MSKPLSLGHLAFVFLVCPNTLQKCYALCCGKQVDVWSAGILFYQMLFGRRPFGHDQTQERILREDTIIKARKVEFPSRPAVSNEAKVSLRFSHDSCPWLVVLCFL